jgi:hypothetical protein
MLTQKSYEQMRFESQALAITPSKTLKKALAMVGLTNFLILSFIDLYENDVNYDVYESFENCFLDFGLFWILISAV